MSIYQLPVGGYAEALVYFPGSGTIVYNWPAFWLVGNAWPGDGEIDVAEIVDTMTVNYWWAGPSNIGAYTVPGNWGGGWHTYGTHRKTTTADIYYDGVLVRTLPTNDPGNGLKLFLTQGDGWNNRVYTSPGNKVLVDWVRAWEPGSGGGGGGTIALTGTTSLYENASSLTAVVPVPAGVVAGEVLVASIVISHTGVSVITPPAGWVEVIELGSGSGSGLRGGLYYRVATGGEAATYTWTSNDTAGRISGVMQRFSGVNTTTPMDVAVQSVYVPFDTTGTTITVPSITTVTNGAMLIGFAGVMAATSTGLPGPPGMTEIATTTGTGRRQTLAYEARPTAGATGTRVWTTTGTAGLERFGVTAALRPA